ncbi:MAG: RnfABCDGE type electron transport complex subunit G [Deltaproteobacteria bacterium]|jgi:electron transport complex protein RnfG|nr:RnfABCDGE type electron transport complex subunit G [Deltaproteobacteria bacterium]
MREIIKMVIVLTILSCFSGGLLAYINTATEDRIENQVLQFVKGPAVRSIFADATNDPITDRILIKDGEIERTFFFVFIDGEPRGMAFETFGKGGYGGDVGLMVGIDVNEDALIGVGVTTHAETPGMGAKAKTDPSFAAQYEGLSVKEPIKVTNDGGTINSISGATMTSRAVSSAATEAAQIYLELKPQLTEKLKEIKK